MVYSPELKARFYLIWGQSWLFLALSGNFWLFLKMYTSKMGKLSFRPFLAWAGQIFLKWGQLLGNEHLHEVWST